MKYVLKILLDSFLIRYLKCVYKQYVILYIIQKTSLVVYDNEYLQGHDVE